MRHPRRLSAPASSREGFDPFGYEILQEKAATLARLGGRLEEALQALAAFDAAHAGGAAPGGAPVAEEAQQRRKLVARAGEALWYYVVQREVCGLRDTEALLRELRVPREVRLRIGYFPSAAEK